MSAKKAKINVLSYPFKANMRSSLVFVLSCVMRILTQLTPELSRFVSVEVIKIVIEPRAMKKLIRKMRKMLKTKVAVKQ